MSDEKNTPFAVRMELEDKEKLLKMIQESGRSNKEFMSTLLSAYELNKAKIEIPDLAKDIEGLQALTQRINEYYVNIGKRIEDTQKAKDIQYTKDIEVYKSRIEVLKEENEKVNSDYETLQQAYNNTCNDIEESKKQLTQLRETQESNKALIKEYQSKVDTLSGILEEYKSYKEENKELIENLKNLEAEVSNTKLALKEANAETSLKEQEIERINKVNTAALITEQTNNHKEIENLKIVAELERGKALLEADQKHQKMLVELTEKFNSKLEGVTDKLEAQRELNSQLKEENITMKAATQKKEPRTAKVVTTKKD